MNPEAGGSSPPAPAVVSVTSKLFVVGRRDLQPGLRVAQMFHAARTFASEHPFIEGEWFRQSNTIVLLEVADANSLDDLVARARAAGVSVSSFAEEMVEGTTAVALGPDAWRLVSSLPLALK